MKKTSVYLSDEEAAALRQAARVSGRSQAELIRDGVRQMLAAAGVQDRVFHSMGRGHGRGASPSWDPDELYRDVMGAS
jgi:ribbon-helix-helix CopG family protein